MRDSVLCQLDTFSAVNQGNKMVKVITVMWPKTGSVNKMEKQMTQLVKRVHLLIYAALKLSIDKFCT